MGLVAGTVDFVLFETFLARVVERSSIVVGSEVWIGVVVLGGCRSAGGSRLDCLGVRDGGKK